MVKGGMSEGIVLFLFEIIGEVWAFLNGDKDPRLASERENLKPSGREVMIEKGGL